MGVHLKIVRLLIYSRVSSIDFGDYLRLKVLVHHRGPGWMGMRKEKHKTLIVNQQGTEKPICQGTEIFMEHPPQGRINCIG